MQLDYNRTYYCLCRTYYCKMAVDPKEQLITDGRLFNHPIKHYGVPTVLTIDLDFAALQIISKLEDVYLNEDRICD
ncbi:hypothetical protein V6N13_007977 [Hibiscus sabdariffa]|uniref:Uncharacterized protein n=1 Tax=Hibiscus sabdariffa TaxID=183260 RepID=A0ABR2EE35_9ROSI